jgi:glycosyltransferase involved in cell wall biosynthesis
MEGKLSVILCSYKSKDRIAKVRNQLHDVLTSAFIPYELIIVDDGSLDGSSEVALTLEKQFENVNRQ